MGRNPKGKLVFPPSISRGELLVSGGVFLSLGKLQRFMKQKGIKLKPLKDEQVVQIRESGIINRYLLRVTKSIAQM